MKDINMETSQTACNSIWHKYRPVILRLMVNARDASQRYLFSNCDFKTVVPTSRSSLAFILYFHRSKALNNIKTSSLAQALLGILKQSKTAIRLSEDSTYELMLDEHFMFHVRKNSVPLALDRDMTSVAPISYVECLDTLKAGSHSASLPV